MITAVDTSVLLSIFKGETNAGEWMELLIHLAESGSLVSCSVVWAEISPLFKDAAEMQKRMDALGILYDPILEEAAFLAGHTFAVYRNAGGPRQHLIPDFMIAAHAQTQAEGLVAADRGYIRRYFKRVRLYSIGT